jgi:hypothetical protein
MFVDPSDITSFQLQFAVKYQNENSTFWDSNDGSNYSLSMLIPEESHMHADPDVTILDESSRRPTRLIDQANSDFKPVSRIVLTSP